MKSYLQILLLSVLLISYKVSSQPYGWFTQTSGTTNNLTNSYFQNSSTGYVVGQSGTVLKTTNGGTNWFGLTSGVSNHLYAVTFTSAATGYIVGDVGIILKTTNNGASWSAQSSTTNVKLLSISFRDANTGYVVGWYGTFLRTTNGGASWTKYQTSITTDLYSVSFADASTGFAVGQFGKIVRTVNGGVNWSEVSSGTTLQLEFVSFMNTNNGTVIGENGIIRVTSNSGLNWAAQTSGTSGWLNGMSIQNSNFCVVVGQAGLVRKTSNGGLNWYSQTSNTASWLNKTSFVDTNIGWAVGDNGVIIKTTTGGWVLPGTATLNSPNNGVTCFSVTGTLDWSDVFPPISNYRVQIATDQNFTNIILNTPGVNESQFNIPASALQHNTLYYWRVKATNQVGESPNWSSVRNFRTTTLVPTVPGLIVPPDNSSTGLTPLLCWDSITTATIYRCRIATDINFNNVILDSNNIVNRAINVPAGRLQPNTRYYWRVNAGNSCNTSAYSVTWSFITNDLTGINLTNSEIPKQFELYSNYPNPFNPVTNINFDLPQNSNVKITVFSVLGEVVAELVNSKLAAGKYSIDWDASAYGSGIYLYRIEAIELIENGRQFVKTKKMVLVK